MYIPVVERAGLPGLPGPWWQCRGLAHWRTTADYVCDRPGEPDIQLMLILGGRGRGTYLGAPWTAGPGTAVLLDLTARHAYASDPNDPWDLWWLRFDGPGIHEWVDPLLDQGPVFALADPRGMHRRMDAIVNALNERRPGWECWIHHHLVGVVAALHESRNQSRLGAGLATGGPLWPVVKAVRERLAAGWDVAGMARLAGLSRAQFTRRFVQAFGQPPMRWLEQLRIEVAQEHLRLRPDHPVADIGMRVGFTSASHFIRVFRAHVGHPPQRWRRLFAGIADPE